MKNIACLILFCLVFATSCKTNNKKSLETKEISVENLEERLREENVAIESLKKKYPNCGILFHGNKLVKTVVFGEGHMGSLPEELRMFSYVNDITAMNNQIKTLPDWLPELDHLSLLFLDQNKFETLPHILNQCKSLTILSLSKTHIKSFRLDSVLPNLEAVSLSYCPLEEFPIIPQTEASPALKLSLSKTPLKAIPKEIANMRLKRLSMIDNQLEYIAPEIGMLKDLEELDLSGCPKLNAQFPETIGNCTKLTNLTLNWCGLQEFPMFITKLVNLEFLILDNNLIEEIPSGIGNLHRLYYFRMKENNLSTLPKELNQLPSLWYLGLEYNNISEFPTEMFDIKRDTLCVLVLDGNPVRGIPVSEEQFHKGYKHFGEKQ